MISMLGLHGSSGHPHFIDDFIEKLAPELLRNCPRGTIADGEGFTFFKRRADKSIPPQELIDLAKESLSDGGCVSAYGMSNMLVVGFSSGAIFGTALLSVAPEAFAGAILLRPQPISEGFSFPDLSGKPVLIISGMNDQRREPHHAFRVGEQLSTAGASVTHHDLDIGHGLAADDLALARAWMTENFPPRMAGQGI